jgi:hypothetical protein
VLRWELHEHRNERRAALADHAAPQPSVGDEQDDAARRHEGTAIDQERSTDALVPGVVRDEPGGNRNRSSRARGRSGQRRASSSTWSAVLSGSASAIDNVLLDNAHKHQPHGSGDHDLAHVRYAGR